MAFICFKYPDCMFFCYLHLKEDYLLVPLDCTVLKNVKCLFVFIKKNPLLS